MMKNKPVFSGFIQSRNIYPSGYEYYVSGMNALIENQLELAASCLTKAVEINSDIPEAFYLLGKIFLQNGDLPRAVKVFRDLLLRKNLPEDLKLRSEAALISLYSGSGQFLKAQTIAEQQLKKYPFDNRIRQILVTLLERQHKFTEAGNYWKECCRFSKTSPNPRLALYLVESSRRIDEKNTVEKVRLLNKAVKINPACGPAYADLAKIFQKLNKIRKVLNFWRKILKNAPQTFALLIKDISGYLFEINRYHEFIQIIQPLSRIEGPHRIMIQAEMAQHYLKTGSTENAKQALSEILKEEQKIPRLFKEMLFSYLKDARSDASIEKLKEPIPSLVNLNNYTCLKCRKISEQILWHCPECGAWESFSLLQD